MGTKTKKSLRVKLNIVMAMKVSQRNFGKLIKALNQLFGTEVEWR